MKLLLSILFLICIFQSFAQSGCDCWEQAFENQAVDYEVAVHEMEAAFIHEGLLQNSRPASYLALADSIIAKNRFYLTPVKFNPTLIRKFEKCFIRTLCSSEPYVKIRAMNNKMSNYRTISPSQTYLDFKTIFPAEEFNQIEVKHYFLVFYFATMLQNQSSQGGLLRKLEAPERKVTFEKRNILRVHVGENDSIFVNNNPILFKSLKQLAKAHISNQTNDENSPEIEWVEIEGLGQRAVTKQMISFTNHGGASYRFYLKIQAELNAAYTEVRNFTSLKEFGVSYEEMLENKKKYIKEIKAVRKLIPKNIIESIGE